MLAFEESRLVQSRDPGRETLLLVANLIAWCSAARLNIIKTMVMLVNINFRIAIFSSLRFLVCQFFISISPLEILKT
jgi:hypothetical protein